MISGVKEMEINLIASTNITFQKMNIIDILFSSI